MIDIFTGHGVEITLPDKDAFLKIRETLQRIGVASKKDKILYQSCHILHKQGRYVIVHFKELFSLDGKPTNITDNDLARRNTIALLLENWGLLKILDASKAEENQANLSQIKILNYKEKEDWQMVSKYSIGKKAKKDLPNE